MEWGLRHISSRELTEWMALRIVEKDEADHERDVIESGDGKVIEHGKDTDDEGPVEDDGHE